jgi:hypothetical protein
MDGDKAPRRLKLRGFERMVSMADGVSMKIVHAMLVVGDVQTLLLRLPMALTRTLNVHPRMRALQVTDQAFTAEIQAPVSIDDVTSKKLLRVVELEDDERFEEWQQYAEHECSVGFDRFTQLPFFLTVWSQEKAERARLLLFSDHFMSDGRSDMAVLNCILEQVAQLAKGGEVRAVEEFPLRPSLYDMWLSNKLLPKLFVKALMALLGRAIYRNEMNQFTPVLPARDDQHDFVAPPVENSTKGFYAQGDARCMSHALLKCREEKATVGGAMVAATVLAMYRAAKDPQKLAADQPFKLVADVDYDMRQRVPSPADEDQVGAYAAFCGLEWLAKEGVDLETTRFWALARRAKTEIDANLGRTVAMAAVPVILDQQIHSKMKPSFAKAANIRHSQTSDVNMSNVGRYPYAREFSLTENGDKKLTVKSLHVYNSIPHLGPSACFFLTSVESFSYAMAFKCEEASATALFTAWVAVCENLGNIGAEDSMAQVLRQLKLE